MNILLAINWVDYADQNRALIQKTAIQTSLKNKPDNVRVICVDFADKKCKKCYETDCVLHPVLRRHSKDIGTKRDLPYLKEILDYCSRFECDIFGYMNSDIILDKRFFESFSEDIEDIDAYLFMRTDISRVTSSTFDKGNYRIVWNEHPGYDCFCFRRDWWLANRDKFDDDLIIAEPFFDYYYARTVKENTDRFLEERLLYHVYHKTIWNPNSVGGENNKRINGGTGKYG